MFFCLSAIVSGFVIKKSSDGKDWFSNISALVIELHHRLIKKLQVGHFVVLKIFEKVCLCFQHFSGTNQRDYIFVQVSVVLCLEVVVAFLIQVTIFHDPVRFKATILTLSPHCICNSRLICFFLCQNLTMHTRPTGPTYWVPCASFWLSLEWVLKARWFRMFRYYDAVRSWRRCWLEVSM